MTGLLAVLMFSTRREWKKNNAEFLPEDYNPTDEAIRKEWEVNYLVRTRRAQRDIDRMEAP
jgi:hypothetical protein